MIKSEARKIARRLWSELLPPDDPGSELRARLLANLLANLRDFLREAVGPDTRLVATLALPDEPDIIPILSEFRRPIYAPLTLPEGRMEFRLYLDAAQAPGASPPPPTPGYRGVPGPLPGAPVLDPEPRRSDIIIIPSLAVNPRGYRLGRGGGYYDRRKNELMNARTVSLLPEKLANIDFQEEAHDLRVSTLITENGVRD